MNLGNNLQYLRRLRKDMTQETLAEQLGVSRQTVSKWESNTAVPEIDKAIELCKIFNCSLDSLFREEMDRRSEAYSDLRVEEVEGFRYVEHKDSLQVGQRRNDFGVAFYVRVFADVRKRVAVCNTASRHLH